MGSQQEMGPPAFAFGGREAAEGQPPPPPPRAGGDSLTSLPDEAARLFA